MAKILDLSEHQGTIDFSKLKSQVDFAILRVQDGSSHPDIRYKEYVAECKQYGIPFGTYAFFRGVSVSDAITEAKDAYNRMDEDSEFFALDVEVVTNNDMVRSSQAFIDTLKNKGVQKVGLYSGEYFYNQQSLHNVHADFLWIANYGVNDGKQHTKPKVLCDIWQYSSTGRIDGINTNVDLNVLNGGKPLDYFNGVIPSQSLQVVKVLVNSDVRLFPSHDSAYFGNVHPGELYNVWDRSGDWHFIILDAAKNITGWVDGNGGKNLFWVNNPALTTEPQTYVIKSGDTLGEIAKRFGTTTAQLVTLNGIKNQNVIYPGQRIRIK